MSELFGLPMSTLMWVFSIALILITAWSVFIALRQPVLFRLAARGIPRRLGRSLLIVPSANRPTIASGTIPRKPASTAGAPPAR